MKRQGRFAAAASFLRRFSGKNVVRSYARWFGVDLGCALKELQMLDVTVDPTYVDRLREHLREQGRLGRERNERRRLERAATAEPDEFETMLDFDDPFAQPDELPF